VSAKAFDGLLVIEPPDTSGYIGTLHDQGLPVVMIDDRGSSPGFPSVRTTNREGARAAARHLVSTGRTAFAVVTGPARFGCVRERSDGFRDALGDAGLHVDPRLVVEGDFDTDRGAAATGELMATGLRFDAVFAHNDLSALGVVRALTAAGRKVPDDVAVVGFDDIPIAAHAELTTVRQPMRQPMREMGGAAARLLLARLEGAPPAADPVVLPTTFVARRSG
jgi:LacI family transcriptional regulator